jgi:maltose alpha-D-glucosyltransferase/alpha-amylase
MGDNIWLPDRNGVRTPMQWDHSANAGFSSAEPGRLYAPLIEGERFGPGQVNVAGQRLDPASMWNVLRRMIRQRKAHPALAVGAIAWVDAGSQAVAAYRREDEGECLLILNNLSAERQSVALRLENASPARLEDIFGAETLPIGEQGLIRITLLPYQYRWLILQR